MLQSLVMQKVYATENNRKELFWILIKFPQEMIKSMK